jgi:hypothetical protein
MVRTRSFTTVDQPVLEQSYLQVPTGCVVDVSCLLSRVRLASIYPNELLFCWLFFGVRSKRGINGKDTMITIL